MDKSAVLKTVNPKGFGGSIPSPSAWTLNAVAKIGKMPRELNFTAEDIRKKMKVPPPHPNCVGAAFRIASARGLIVQSWTAPAKRPEAAGHLLRMWRRR